MSSKGSSFGVGFSDSSNSLKAGILATKDALEQAGLSAEEVQLCFLFCTSRHEPEDFFHGVKGNLGKHTQFFGGFANGTLTNLEHGYDGYQTVVGVWGKLDFEFELLVQEGIAFHEYETGKAIGQQIARHEVTEKHQMLLLFDAVNRLEGKFRMNYGTPFIDGLRESLTQWPNVVGARLLGDMKFKPTKQWIGRHMTQNSAIALLLNGNIQLDYQIMHGCQPASSYHEVTAVQGATILELNHRPAMEVVTDILGEDLQDKLQEVKFFVTLGKNIGDKWGSFNPGNYINRMCVGVDTRSGGLYMAEMDINVGTEVQLMRRGFEMDYVLIRTKKLIDKVRNSGRKIVFGMYINCSGRAAAYSNHTDEDVRYVQQAIGGEFPLLGVYEAGELAKIGNQLEVLDWTGIFCLFSESTP